MKKIIFILVLLAVSCQTTKIKNKTYKTSPATVELGSIGTSTSLNNLKNDFSIKSFPALQNKIRLDIQIVPFTKDINKIYLEKSEVNQTEKKINYIDSLSNKPKFVTVSILDQSGFIEELNANHNKNILTYLKDTEDAAIVKSIALTLSEENIAKLQSADAYYLVNNQDTKYTVMLYKDGKKIDLIDLQSGTVLAYSLGKFCWAINDRQHWYVGDIVNDNKSCKGNTYKKIKKKEETNLFKL